MMITSQASERLVWWDFIGGESEGSLVLVRFLCGVTRGLAGPGARARVALLGGRACELAMERRLISTLSRFADPVRRKRASSLMLDRVPLLFIYL